MVPQFYVSTALIYCQVLATRKHVLRPVNLTF